MTGTAEEPVVSFVVPAHNAAQTLERAIESVRRQTAATWELIVVDDRSTDDTAAIARALGSGDPRTRCIESPGCGVSAARNAGVRAARGEWLLFLDADDWIAPETIEQVLEAVRKEAGVDMVCYGWQRVTDQGEIIQTAHPWFGEEPFTACASSCPITIHVCVVRTDRVRALGGFDESLATCEDLDLWMRVARAGARIVRLPRVLAFYRTSPGSASKNPFRLLDDGLLVLARAHAADPRVPSAPPAVARGRPVRELPSRRYSWLAWVAGYHLVAGGDPRALPSRAPFGPAPTLRAETIADMIGSSLLVAAVRPGHRFVELWSELRGAVETFVRELCAAAGVRPFAAQVTRRIELATLAGPGAGNRDLSRCSSRSVALDQPVPDLTFPDGIEVCRLHLTYAGEPVGTVGVPVIQGRVGAAAVAAAAGRRRHWDILGRYFGGTLLPSLVVHAEPDGAWSVRRGPSVLASGLPEAPGPGALHDLVGWTLLQQEVWGDPRAALDDFYSSGRSRFARWRPARSAGGVVDIARPLRWRRSAGHTLTLTPRIGGALCEPVHVAARGPGRRVSPRAQREAIVRQLGIHLSEHVAREALIGQPLDASRGIRERLRRAASRANGLMLGVGLAPWVAYEAWTHRKRRLDVAVILGLAVASVPFSALFYTLGYTWGINPDSPSTAATLSTSVKFLAMGLGPAVRAWWTLWSLVAGLFLIAGAIPLLKAALRSDLDRRGRPLGILLFQANMTCLGLAMGWGRAALVPKWGMPDRYALMAVPALLASYFVWELYGPPLLRKVAPLALAVTLAGLVPANTERGFQFRDWYVQGMEAFERDVEAGVPRSVLAQDHYRFLLHWDVENLRLYMQMLSPAKIGIFPKIREDPGDLASRD